jgi:hypothetical protein
LRRGRSGDDLDSVGEFHTCDQLWQLVVAVKAAPGFLRGLDELEHHRKRGLVGEAALRSDRAVSHRGERALDRIRAPQVLPMLGGEVVKGEQRIAIFGQTFDRLGVFRSVGFCERLEGGDGLLLRFGHPDLLQRALGLAVQALRQLVEDIRRLMHVMPTSA